EFGGGERWMIGMAVALRERGHVVRILSRPEAAWAEAAEAERLEVTPVPMVHDLSSRSGSALVRNLRRARPDVVVCCNQRAVRLGVLAAWLAGRLPVVFRNGLAGSFKNSGFNRWIAHGVSRFVVNAQALCAEISEFGWIPPERISVIYNGVDCGYYTWPRSDRPRERWGVPADSIVVAAAGRLVED